jgi:hypothetical protein
MTYVGDRDRLNPYLPTTPPILTMPAPSQRLDLPSSARIMTAYHLFIPPFLANRSQESAASYQPGIMRLRLRRWFVPLPQLQTL